MSRKIVNNEPSVCYNPDQVISLDVHVFIHQEPFSPTYSPNDSERTPEPVLPVLSDDLDMPIAFRKGKRQPCPNPRYPMSQYVVYESFSSKFRVFIATISYHHIPDKFLMLYSS